MPSKDDSQASLVKQARSTGWYGKVLSERSSRWNEDAVCEQGRRGAGG